MTIPLVVRLTLPNDRMHRSGRAVIDCSKVLFAYNPSWLFVGGLAIMPVRPVMRNVRPLRESHVLYS